MSEKSKLFKNLCVYALKLKESPFDYIPLTFFIEADLNNQKQFTKLMMPFMNSYYSLEDNKKKATKYFMKLEEFMVKSKN